MVSPICVAPSPLMFPGPVSTTDLAASVPCQESLGSSPDRHRTDCRLEDDIEIHTVSICALVRIFWEDKHCAQTIQTRPTMRSDYNHTTCSWTVETTSSPMERLGSTPRGLLTMRTRAIPSPPDRR